jgi:hypothetical protein
VRHALVTTQLIYQARAAADAEAESERRQDPIEAQAGTDPEPRRLATLGRRFATLGRRARARTLGLGAGTPGGGA